MSAWNRWRGRLGAVLGTAVLSVFVPAAAWASSGSGETVVQATRYHSGGFSAFDCFLMVVFVIVALVVLLIRNHRNRPPR